MRSPDDRAVRVNTTYIDLPVGSGTYTRNVKAALPEATGWQLPRFLLGTSAIPFWLKRLAELLGTFGIRRDTVHPYWAASWSRKDVIAILDFVQYDEASRAERFLLRRAATNAGCLLTLSSEIAVQLSDRLGRSAVVAPCFPEPAWFAPPAEKRRLALRDDIHLAYWGGFHSRKNVERFVADLAQSTLRRRIVLHHTGPSPDWIVGSGLKIRSYQRLSTTELVGLVDRCDIALYPSREEGFGLPVFEALLRDRPVVVSPLRVYGEFSRPSDGRIEWTAGSPEDVVGAIDAALSCTTGAARKSLLRATYEENRTLLRDALLNALGDVR